MMKMVTLIAVKAFEDKIKKLLADQKVLTYSYTTVVGFRDSTQDAVSTNWFGTEMNKTESLLFVAFLEAHQADKVFEEVTTLNQTCDLRSRVHIAIMPIERSN